MKVPFLDLGVPHAALREELELAMRRVLQSSCFIGGPEVEAFESEFAAYAQAGECITVGNGLDALRLTLLALGVGRGDEVIVPSHTFIATWLAVSQCGATPVPVEPAAGGFNIDPAQVAAAVTPRTKAIVPVHLYGEPAGLALHPQAQRIGAPGGARRHRVQVDVEHPPRRATHGQHRHRPGAVVGHLDIEPGQLRAQIVEQAARADGTRRVARVEPDQRLQVGQDRLKHRGRPG